jgi:hypothetical protein
MSSTCGVIIAISHDAQEEVLHDCATCTSDWTPTTQYQYASFSLVEPSPYFTRIESPKITSPVSLSCKHNGPHSYPYRSALSREHCCAFSKQTGIALNHQSLCYYCYYWNRCGSCVLRWPHRDSMLHLEKEETGEVEGAGCGRMHRIRHDLRWRRSQVQ